MDRVCAKGALVYGILEGFASFETRHFTGFNLDSFTGPRITTLTGCTLLYSKRTKTNQRYLAATLERTRNRINHRIYSTTCICFRKTCRVCY